ncbi:myotubularin related protein 12-like protein [Camelus ferus]|nr:myotubularin related protein 12-like protein [Camelus ferus]
MTVQSMTECLKGSGEEIVSLGRMWSTVLTDRLYDWPFWMDSTYMAAFKGANRFSSSLQYDESIWCVHPECEVGEQLLCEANTVLKCVQEDSCQRGIYGRLVCTDFKIAFLGDDESALDNDIVSGIIHHTQSPKLLKRLFLFSYAAAAQNSTAADPKNHTVMFDTLKDWCWELERTKGNVKFKAVSINEGYRVCERLPAYFVVPTPLPEEDVSRFQGHGIPICLEPASVTLPLLSVSIQKFCSLEGVLKSPLTSSGPSLRVSPCPVPLPDFLGVAQRMAWCVLLSSLARAAAAYQCMVYMAQIWCWSCHNGCALLKMSALPKEQDDGILQVQKNFLDGIYKTIHRPPYEIVKTEDLSSNFLSLQEIQTAYSKFKQLFLIGEEDAATWGKTCHAFVLPLTLFLTLRFSFCGRTGTVSACGFCWLTDLSFSTFTEHPLEENASDLCCLISSLVQVMMDPHCRTRFGFQSLVQKEWIMGGHCFLDRCNHLRQSDKEEVPVFLLFLDCVWQLVHQHPPAFEFTETYLTVLSDSLYIPIFSTFFFNSPHQKDGNVVGAGGLSASGWRWEGLELKGIMSYQPQQRTLKPRGEDTRGFFREETDHLIKNLLGKRISKLINSSEELQDNFREFYESWHSKPTNYHGLLLPHIEGPEIKVWAQRYLRWIPEAQILGGGRVATMNKLLEMMEEVQCLQEKIEEKHHSQEALQAEATSLLRNSVRLSSLFPFALLQRHSSKPVLPTSGWKALGDEEDLAKREDEFVDLGDV